MRIFGYKAKGNSIKYLLCEDSNSDFYDESQVVSFREISYPYSFLILGAPDEEEERVRQKELPLLIIVRPEYLEEESDALNYKLLRCFNEQMGWIRKLRLLRRHD